MDLWDAAKVVGRHWIVVAVGLMAAAAVTYTTYSRIAPSFEASGVAIVVPARAPRDSTTQQVVSNPYATFGGTLTATAQVLTEVARGTEIAEKVRRAAGRIKYDVAAGAQTPTLTVAATGDTASAVLRTVDVVLTAVSDDFEARQADVGVPPEMRLRLDVVAAPTRAFEMNQSRMKATGLVAVLGGIAAMSLAFVVEAIGAGRRRRTASTGKVTPSGPSPGPPRAHPATPPAPSERAAQPAPPAAAPEPAARAEPSGTTGSSGAANVSGTTNGNGSTTGRGKPAAWVEEAFGAWVADSATTPADDTAPATPAEVLLPASRPPDAGGGAQAGDARPGGDGGATPGGRAGPDGGASGPGSALWVPGRPDDAG